MLYTSCARVRTSGGILLKVFIVQTLNDVKLKMFQYRSSLACILRNVLDYYERELLENCTRCIIISVLWFSDTLILVFFYLLIVGVRCLNLF